MPSVRCWMEPTRWTPFRSRSRSTCPLRKSRGRDRRLGTSKRLAEAAHAENKRASPRRRLVKFCTKRFRGNVPNLAACLPYNDPDPRPVGGRSGSSRRGLAIHKIRHAAVCAAVVGIAYHAELLITARRAAVISSPIFDVFAVYAAGLGLRRGHIIYSGVSAAPEVMSPT
jgi:hypothetical protein